MSSADVKPVGRSNLPLWSERIQNRGQLKLIRGGAASNGTAVPHGIGD